MSSVRTFRLAAHLIGCSIIAAMFVAPGCVRIEHVRNWPRTGDRSTQPPTEPNAPTDSGSSSSDVAYQVDRRPGIIVPCGGVSRTPVNPQGLRSGMNFSPERAQQYYRSNYLRVERLGLERIVWHMPAGWSSPEALDTSDMRGASQSLAAMGVNAEPFKIETRAFLQRNPNATVGVYMSAQVPLSASRPGNVEGAYEIYDHANAVHRRRMIDEIIKPYLEIGVKEIWFDHSAPQEYRSGILQLAAHLRQEYGLHCVMEGVPRTAENQPDVEVMRRMASSAWFRFFRIFDRDRTWTWPDDVEVNLILSAHTLEGETSTGISTDSVAHYRDLGATIWSMSPAYDRYVVTQRQDQQP